MAKKKTAGSKRASGETTELGELVDLNSGMAMLLDGQHLAGVESQLEEIHGVLEMILAVLEKQGGQASAARKKG